MKKAKIALSAVAILGVVGSALAFKAIKRANINYFTTQVSGATATKTLTHAITVEPLAAGNFRYYTLADNAKATNYSKVVGGENQ